MKKIKNIFIILIFCLSTISCSGGLDGFKMKKKSTSGDEFLIEKKDPLVQPPDFSKLPNPDEEINNSEENKSEIEIVFKNENLDSEESKSSETSDSSLEKSILKKIQKFNAKQ
tara:strand:+ start:338 stop:676 length:339 start_codon:yes stop_codon:yes gene_type:complete